MLNVQCLRKQHGSGVDVYMFLLKNFTLRPHVIIFWPCTGHVMLNPVSGLCTVHDKDTENDDIYSCGCRTGSGGRHGMQMLPHEATSTCWRMRAILPR